MISLSNRMRPKKIDDFVGQEHFLFKGSILYNAVKNKKFDNGIFFGPAGTGKTSLARIIAGEMDGDFVELNATTSSTKDLKDIIETAKNKFYGIEKRATYVYIDEIHRWNKLQQDTLLKALEDGIIKFIGSTTENPYFSVNNAVLSRVRNIYEFKKHSHKDIKKLLNIALADKVVGLGNMGVSWSDEAMDALAQMSDGDGRLALDFMEYISNNARIGEEDITVGLVEEAMQKRAYFFNEKEDKYNLLSALQKSIRGSDPHASVYYLARLFEGGVDIGTIGRRLMVIASEDVGMAYPNAISIVTACVHAAHMIGYPEAEITLTQAAVLLASSPKSNASYMALKRAKEDIRTKNGDDIPNHIKDGHYRGAVDRGIVGYLYPHDFGGYVKQQYLPDSLYDKNVKYYMPTENGQEKTFKSFLEKLEKEGKNEE